MQNGRLWLYCPFSSSLLIRCLTLPLAGFIQIAQAEPQRTCSRSTAENLPSGCHQVCQCRPPPLLPPPPPPPPPPRLAAPITIPACCVEETWWHFLLIVLAAVVLFIVVILCYKAIKRKPLHKEENGTTRAEYAMTLETA
ncbi:PREDICTED: proline-rich membrane anchor 1 [Nanorana parkeri]|uniref:proline-rich membrane anchor 1 n=1 Tax=Nanorana parkeri TaxID=125878 RepID=UPI000854E0C9|nr:PREDICTED: proline-rich membrane anchor 1 [Nanorana parkeri]